MQSFTRIVIVLAVAIIAITSAAVQRPSSPMKIGYWGSNPSGKTSTLAQLETALDNGYNVINFAYYNPQADGKLVLDTGSITPTRKSQIHTAKQFTYLASLFGGANGIGPRITMSADDFARAMFNNFATLQQQYEFDGVHIDLENVWGATPDVLVCALRSFFRLMHNAGNVVSMAPQSTAVSQVVSLYASGSWNAYVPLLDTGIIDNVDIISVKMYNNQIYGDNAATYTDSLINGFSVSGSPTCDGTVTGKVKIPASKMVHGWPAAAGAATGCPSYASGCPYGSALSTLYAASASLKSTAGVMGYAIEFDGASNWQFINAAGQIAFNGASAAPATARPGPVQGTTAPVATSKPAATAAPVATQKPAATQAPSTGNTKCKMTWTQKISSSWTQGCNTLTMYTVTMYADAPLADFRFTIDGAVQSVWDANTDSGAYKLPSWLFQTGKMAKGQVASFGYIIAGNSPATISVIGDPCQ